MRIEPRERGFRLLVAIALAYAVVFSGIAIWRYHHFLSDASGDLLLFEQVVYNTAHGRPFYNNFSRQNHFGDHNSPMLGVLALFSYVLPVPYVLYIATALSISVSSIPIYLIARDLLPKAAALSLACLYLLLPAFVGQFYQSFHEINLVLPFLSFSFYYFYRERFGPFCALFVLALLVKEDVALTLFMFAPYAVIKRRDKRWYLFPALTGLAWFFLSTKVVIPYFSRASSYQVGFGYFSSLGSSFSEIAANVLGRPLHTLQVITSPDRRLYLLYLLLPVGLVLPLLSAEVIFAIPSVLLNLLADSGRFRLASFTVGSQSYYSQKHMSLMACSFLVIALVFSIRKAVMLAGKQSNRVMIGLLLLVSAATLYIDRFLLVGNLYAGDPLVARYQPAADSVERILSLIPPGATVTSNRGISAHLYDRKESYYDFGNLRNSDYVVLTGLDLALNRGLPDAVRDYDPVSAERNVYLLKRRL